jgi:hypothetical protein
VLVIQRQVASGKNKSKRWLFSNVVLQIGSAEVAFQVISFIKIFDVGFPPLIQGKTIVSPVNRTMKGPQRGSLKATCSQNGKRKEAIVCYGYMGNVSPRPALTISAKLIAFPFRSRRREECYLVR